MLNVARRELGDKEILGSNRGLEVVKYQKSTWLTPGSWPWCAAFVDWVFQQAQAKIPQLQGITRPKTAGAFDLENWGKKAGRGVRVINSPSTIKQGDIIVFSFSHCGFALEDSKGSRVRTVEGNTNKAGSREGTGVYEKNRKLSRIRSVIRITV
jgi:hypothetical protein